MGRAVVRRSRRPLVIDLYAGAGGLSLGLEQAGFDVVGAVEFDPIHALVHRFNFPDTPVLCRDLSTVTADELLSLAAHGWALRHGDVPFPGLDALVGGPPCQGFSVGGVRLQDDERNNQLLRFVQLVRDVRPRVFLLENVAGLLEPRFDDLRETALAQLRGAGYEVSGTDTWVNAADFGVPQSRRRLLILGGLEASPSLPAPVTPTGVLVQDAFEGLPELTAYRRLLRTDSVLLSDADQLRRLAVSGDYARTLSGLTRRADDRSYPRLWDADWLTGSLRTVHAPATVQRFRRTRQGAVEPKSRLYRLALEGVSRTLRAGTGTDRGSHTSPRPIHPTKDRVITVREAARLHGYPDWFRFHVTNWHGHRQIGNSVPPPLAAAAGRALVAALGLPPRVPRRQLALGDPAWLRCSPTEARGALTDLALTQETPDTAVAV